MVVASSGLISISALPWIMYVGIVILYTTFAGEISANEYDRMRKLVFGLKDLVREFLGQ